VPSHHRRTNADALEQRVHREIGDAERGLCDAGVGDLLALRRGLLRREGRFRKHATEDRFSERCFLVQKRKRDEQVRQHSGSLTSLSRENERDLARRKRLRRVGHENIFDVTPAHERVQLVVQIGDGARDDRRADRQRHLTKAHGNG